MIYWSKISLNYRFTHRNLKCLLEYYFSMTKERRTIILSKELDETIAFLASARQMSLSQFLETRLRTIPEIQKQIERFHNLPDDPIIDVKKIEGKTGREIPSRLISKMPIRSKGSVLASQ